MARHLSRLAAFMDCSMLGPSTAQALGVAEVSQATACPAAFPPFPYVTAGKAALQEVSITILLTDKQKKNALSKGPKVRCEPRLLGRHLQNDHQAHPRIIARDHQTSELDSPFR